MYPVVDSLTVSVKFDEHLNDEQNMALVRGIAVDGEAIRNGKGLATMCACARVRVLVCVCLCACVRTCMCVR